MMTTAAQFELRTPATEWNVCQAKTFTVQIRAWFSDGTGWHWNVYALIFDGHPLHKDVEAALGLHFHWGVTLENRIVTTPAQGLRYDWQKVGDCLKLGSDYQHHGDNYEDSDPKDGIPTMIRHDAELLITELNERCEVSA
jgi:hypothetical protein